MTRKNLPFLVSTLIICSVIISLPISVRADSTTNLLYVNPPATSEVPAGTTFDIQVKVAYFAPFNGWDIHVAVNPSVLNPVALAITPNIFSQNVTSSSPTELSHCINGIGPPGSQCSDLNEGPGIVHSAVAYLGQNITASGDGLLFSITYNVVANGYTQITISNDKITDGTLQGATHTDQQGTYGNQNIQPDFNISANTTVMSITVGLSQNATINLNSLDNFAGQVYMTADVSLPGVGSVTSPKALLSPNNVLLQGNGQNSSTIEITTRSSDSITTYSVTVTATSGTISHSQSITVTVNPVGDFIMDITPRSLSIHATDSGSSIITLATDTGFSGSIHLRMDVPPVPGLIASLGGYDFTISQDDPATTVFSIRTPPSNNPFVYLVNITASSQSSTHPYETITVQSPKANFSLQIGGSRPFLQAGQTNVYTLNVTSVDYFKGKLFLLATSLSDMKETFSRNSLALDLGNSSTILMTVATDAYLAPGNHDINVTALGTTFLQTSVNHNIILTITVVPTPVNRTILGVQPLAYFSIVGALWLGVIGAAIKEIRKPKPKRFLN